MRFSFGLIALAAGILGTVVNSADAAKNVKICAKCSYKTINSALASLPNDATTYNLLLYPGIYHEQVKIRRNNVNLKPMQPGFIQIEYNGFKDTQRTNGTNEDSATLSVFGTNVKVYDMTIANLFPQNGGMANLALNLAATQASFYNVKFYGYQDTLLVNRGATGFFKKCYVEGSVDYIWGEGTAVFEHSTIATNRKGGYATAHRRGTASSAGGFFFNSCYIKATLPSGPLVATQDRSVAFTSASQFPNSWSLGRPWNEFARVVYRYCNIDNSVKVEGWSKWDSAVKDYKNVNFGEYKNSGAGQWNSKRASFAHQVTDAENAKYSNAVLFGNAAWIDTTYQ
ncbi:pectin lyase fold/virulence factor [Phycomyces nitens]|nr:pectin lyase fold/virulence factor [Phycomyces nitens]